jgi:arylsulfatase A-like enzyme
MKRLASVILIASACSHPSSSTDAPPADGVASAPDTPPAAHAPNIVFILTDDLDRGVYDQTPRLKTLLDDQGTSFTRHYLNISLCCPSRTAILRGQYAHNTKIFSNAPPTGGFETFYANGSEAQTMAVWLQQAGYTTALFGKYLNGYPNTAPADYIPPGWSEWYSAIAGNPYGEYNYTLDENGKEVVYGAAPGDYMVDVISAKLDDFITRAGASGKPFFAYVAPFSPHAPATPAPRYANDFPLAQAPRTPGWNEADVSDKPMWLQTHPLLTQPQIAAIDALYRKRLQSMEGIADLVEHTIDTLQKTGHLGDTYIVFTSDNGFHQGQHRLLSGKNTEFDEDLIVPLVVRGPGVAAGATVDVPTVNVDFAPTFVDLAGAAIPAAVDGRSLVPFLRGQAPASWRQSVLLEHGADVPDGEAMLWRASYPKSALEPADVADLTAAAAAAEAPPPFVGVRTGRYTYVEYQTGEKELYDDENDPAQLVNLAATADPALLAQLAAAAHALNGCQGDACRTAEAAAVP